MSDAAFLFLQWLYWATLLATCGSAAVFGGREHRAVAAIHAATSLLSAAAASTVGRGAWLGWQPAIFLIDLAAMAGFTAVALRSPAFWPLWVAGFHLDAILTHAVRWLSPVSLPAGYSILQGFWAYPVMAALAVGTWHHHRHRRYERPG